jgi:hypothetical protein
MAVTHSPHIPQLYFFVLSREIWNRGVERGTWLLYVCFAKPQNKGFPKRKSGLKLSTSWRQFPEEVGP